MKEEKNNIKYSTEDIRKYLDGQLSDQEMQALEKAALEDPFLSDAMEGIEESRNHKISFESGVEDLQKRLTERIREKKRASAILLLFSKWKITASVIFILGISILTLTYFNNKTSRSEIAKSNKNGNGTSTRSPVTTSAVNSDSDKSNIVLNKQVVTEKKLRRKNLLSLNHNKTPDSLIIKPVERPADYSYKSSDSVAAQVAAIPSVAKNDGSDLITTESAKKKAEYKSEGFARTEDKALPGNYIKGVVMDDKGKPIPYADVSIKGVKKRAITDQAGFFKLYTIDPEFATQVMISSTGYEPVLELLKPDSSYTNLIKLAPASTALNEVTTMKPDTQSVTQVSGWGTFINYIDSNKKILTADSVLRGDEVISFVVNNKSELSSFKIEKSLSPVHDAEIIRMIKAAPRLTLIKGKKKRLRVNISFN